LPRKREEILAQLEAWEKENKAEELELERRKQKR